MRNVSPHMRIFLSYSLYTYGDSPYAYGDQFLMCLWAIFGWVTPWTRFFWMRVRTHQHQKTSLVEYCLVHHNKFCVARSPFAFRDIISLPICVRGYRSAHHIWDIAPHSPLVFYTGIWSIPICIQGLHDMRSLYAYGDQDQSPYAYGDRRMHTGVKINPRMHTGNAC